MNGKLVIGERLSNIRSQGPSDLMTFVEELKRLSVVV